MAILLRAEESPRESFDVHIIWRSIDSIESYHKHTILDSKEGCVGCEYGKFNGSICGDRFFVHIH